MLRIDRAAQTIYSSQTYQVPTPDGIMYVNMIENKDGNLVAIDIQIGKAGGSLRAWAHCFGRFLTMCLEHGAYIDDLVEELSSQTSDKSLTTLSGIKIRSGPEGIFVALMKYKNDRFQVSKKALKVKGNGAEKGSLRKGA